MMPPMTTRGTKRSGHCYCVVGHLAAGPPSDDGASNCNGKGARRTKMVIVSCSGQHIFASFFCAHKETFLTAIKRSDSLTSGKRKVSSISDDTSEQNSGDESPGVMSNEDNVNDDDSVYMPWLNTMIEFVSSLNFRYVLLRNINRARFLAVRCPCKQVHSSRILSSAMSAAHNARDRKTSESS